MRTIVLFTRDLRVHDHPALVRAVETSREIVPLFVMDPDLLGSSPNRDRFLLECLADLDASLQRLGGRLFVRRGPVAAQVREVAVRSGSTRVLVSEDVSTYAVRRERELAEALSAAGIDLTVFPGNAVVPPGAMPRAAAYRLFTPYHRVWLARTRRAVVGPPAHLRVPDDLEPGSRPDPRSVAPDAIDAPLGGERVGRRRMHAFLGRELRGYGVARDDLSDEGTSRLSPYLRFGCLSATELAARAVRRHGAELFLRQLAWRDFFLQLFAEDPSLAWRDLRPAVGVAEPPVAPDRALAAWRDGLTGLPLVDAGMRQLRREGWMHNRARLVTASFLTRRLGVRWQQGARHFSELLFDADVANNAGNWQWAAGTGVDPRRARTLNPIRQARRFDPTGDYIRRYVDELADVPASRIFTPWVDPDLLRRTGYPEPLVAVSADRLSLAS
jgi:deoxyribodipyrimidine photo-lyase